MSGIEGRKFLLFPHPEAREILFKGSKLKLLTASFGVLFINAGILISAFWPGSGLHEPVK